MFEPVPQVNIGIDGEPVYGPSAVVTQEYVPQGARPYHGLDNPTNVVGIPVPSYGIETFAGEEVELENKITPANSFFLEDGFPLWIGEGGSNPQRYNFRLRHPDLANKIVGHIKDKYEESFQAMESGSNSDQLVLAVDYALSQVPELEEPGFDEGVVLEKLTHHIDIDINLLQKLDNVVKKHQEINSIVDSFIGRYCADNLALATTLWEESMFSKDPKFKKVSDCLDRDGRGKGLRVLPERISVDHKTRIFKGEIGVANLLHVLQSVNTVEDLLLGCSTVANRISADLALVKKKQTGADHKEVTLYTLNQDIKNHKHVHYIERILEDIELYGEVFNMIEGTGVYPFQKLIAEITELRHGKIAYARLRAMEAVFGSNQNLPLSLLGVHRASDMLRELPVDITSRPKINDNNGAIALLKNVRTNSVLASILYPDQYLENNQCVISIDDLFVQDAIRPIAEKEGRVPIRIPAYDQELLDAGITHYVAWLKDPERLAFIIQSLNGYDQEISGGEISV